MDTDTWPRPKRLHHMVKDFLTERLNSAMNCINIGLSLLLLAV